MLSESRLNSKVIIELIILNNTDILKKNKKVVLKARHSGGRDGKDVEFGDSRLHHRH